MATVITYALGEHDPGSAQSGRTSSETWSPVYLYDTAVGISLYHMSFNLARITTTFLSLPPKVHLRHIAGHAQAPLPLHLCFGLSQKFTFFNNTPQYSLRLFWRPSVAFGTAQCPRSDGPGESPLQVSWTWDKMVKLNWGEERQNNCLGLLTLQWHALV